MPNPATDGAPAHDGTPARDETPARDRAPAHDGPPARYRPCAGIVLVNRDGLIFIGERRGPAGQSWQMPQGGIDRDEKPLLAAKRELLEETGVDRVEFLAESAHWHCYDVPTERQPRHWKGRYVGQCQRWFAFRFTGDDDDIDLEAHEPEFSLWRWAGPDEVLALAVPFKRDVYRAVIDEFRALLKP
ncbi:MAG: RNA pyrophosphohydrolase [Alphaproteobacteria bacterium]|nr:RNA pyrophosphohydrolase [Alphaproteobacteria bacterium]